VLGRGFIRDSGATQSGGHLVVVRIREAVGWGIPEEWLWSSRHLGVGWEWLSGGEGEEEVV
jgi:hypothetical protein